MSAEDCVGCRHINNCLGDCLGYEEAKPQEQTNEEWLKSMNTEQLANTFFEYRYTYATPRQKLWMSANEKCIKTDIVEWLKQPHTNE